MSTHAISNSLVESLGRLLKSSGRDSFFRGLTPVLGDLVGCSVFTAVELQGSDCVVVHSNAPALDDARSQDCEVAIERGAFSDLGLAVDGGLTLAVRGTPVPLTFSILFPSRFNRTLVLAFHGDGRADFMDDLVSAGWRDVISAAFGQVAGRETLEEALSRSQARMEAINFIGDLVGNLDLEVLLPRLMEMSIFISSAQVGSVFLEEDDEMTARVEWGLTLDHASRLCFVDGESVLERTVATGEPQLIADYQDSSRFVPVEGIDVRSCLSIPLVSKGKVLGAVVLVNPESHDGHFTESEKDSVFTIAGLAATTIENAMLYQDSLEKERITEGLRIAQSIQNGMYPKERPALDGYEVAWINFSCDETGGDYFDFIGPRDGSLFVTIGDVVGHGIGAALLMATARANVRALCSIESNVREIGDRLNAFLEVDMDEEKFMTFFLSRLDLSKHRLEYVNAGHDSPIHYRAATGVTIDLETTGLPLGIFPDFEYSTAEVDCIEVDDVLLLTTDGVWEVRDHNEKLYGKDALRECFAKHATLGPEEILERIYADVKQFVGNESFADDVTMVAVKRIR